MIWPKGSMYKENRMGLKMEPWGTPQQSVAAVLLIPADSGAILITVVTITHHLYSELF